MRGPDPVGIPRVPKAAATQRKHMGSWLLGRWGVGTIIWGMLASSLGRRIRVRVSSLKVGTIGTAADSDEKVARVDWITYWQLSDRLSHPRAQKETRGQCSLPGLITRRCHLLYPVLSLLAWGLFLNKNELWVVRSEHLQRTLWDPAVVLHHIFPQKILIKF